MSTNDVVLFGVLAADAEIRSGGGGPAGTRWALLKVETYQFVRDPQTKKPVVSVTEHVVHCFDELSVDPLVSLGKKGFWIRIRGNLAYGENRQAIVRVPVRGGQATVSAYFGNRIRPDVPFHLLVAELDGPEAPQSHVGATAQTTNAGEVAVVRPPPRRPVARQTNPPITSIPVRRPPGPVVRPRLAATPLSQPGETPF
jgi:hypothetical protein